MTPRNPSRIRQEILASILNFKEGLSYRDFIMAKSSATIRNTGRSRNLSEAEHAKWPARPDIFLHYPTPADSVLSDEELAEYFLSDKYLVESFESEPDDKLDVGDDTFLMDIDAVEYTPGCDTGPQNGQHYSGVCGTVEILKELCVSGTSLTSINQIKAYYAISRTKSYEILGAVKDLLDRNIQV